ncbi:hypothetical protein CTM93_03515 [Photobacterium phosphoreum]|nr:hypothetical protein UB41_16195 [Photobacterium phosphoreum]PQJ91268.1 hypothetical protein BTO21_05935 [Photobacterium phosphoreum]PSU85540.1 hypothetical protein CTM93_03515 [Photobacterium phosphoreum]PSV71180.1 hypothetical protein CTM77_08670 [Photobacterium phosphoreum]
MVPSSECINYVYGQLIYLINKSLSTVTMLITLAELVAKNQYSKITNQICNRYICFIDVTIRANLYNLNTVKLEWFMLNKGK